MAMKGFSGDNGTRKAKLGGVRQISGSRYAARLKFGIVVSRFNEKLTSELVRTAVDCLGEHGALEKDITVVWVPGAYEVPGVIHKLAEGGGFDALIALGVVIEGETPHADLINMQVTQSLAQISRAFGVPVIHEVVAARNEEQAVARVMSNKQSRGWYAAVAAIEMARVMEQLR